jgi:hypothetical protein
MEFQIEQLRPTRRILPKPWVTCCLQSQPTIGDNSEFRAGRMQSHSPLTVRKRQSQFLGFRNAENSSSSRYYLAAMTIY